MSSLFWNQTIRLEFDLILLFYEGEMDPYRKENWIVGFLFILFFLETPWTHIYVRTHTRTPVPFPNKDLQFNETLKMSVRKNNTRRYKVLFSLRYTLLRLRRFQFNTRDQLWSYFIPVDSLQLHEMTYFFWHFSKFYTIY